MAEERARIAVIDYRLCQPQGCGNYLCVRVCPVNKMGKDCIIKEGPEGKPAIEEELCTGCGICPKKCPFGAISVINLSVKLGTPVHQFGKNAFRLYRLPLPKEDAVVGIIGRNGIGKSTALKILSGALMANLGDYEEKGSMDRIIEFYRGKEMQKFFEGLKGGTIRVSYKPQQVDTIPLHVKGKVSEILKKSGPKEKLAEISGVLAMESIMDREISKLSGGELQKVAIAAAMLKEADLYAFDEPGSYLDICERLRAAKAIRKLSGNGKKVIVIEHDLALLDYLSDYIHIIFGKAAAYGAISSPKTVRNGINEFLHGFLRDENLRFRPHEIRFEPKAPFESEKRATFAVYPEMEKSFPEFSLKVRGGKIMKGEVIGILGPNAIGKTTFVKMLAGVEEPDNTSLGWNYKLSYKPQYLQPEEGMTVNEFIKSTGIDTEFFSANLEKKLSLRTLYECRLDELSGGELQKVAVSVALSREGCDLILLDEPSAYVDVEDRLTVAEAVRKAASMHEKPVIVVDHDIVFQDYVSDRLVVFEGTPSKEGTASPPAEMREGMNLFLKNMGISFRRDENTGRPRANKEGSVKDREQKESGEYYYKS
jgi:ATP-binding cassette subfamily E protein 1